MDAVPVAAPQSDALEIPSSEPITGPADKPSSYTEDVAAPGPPLVMPPAPALPPAVFGTAPPPAAPVDSPDYFEAGSVESVDGDVVRARDVTVAVTSLVQGGSVLLTADSAEYNTATGEAELSGAVTIEVEGADLCLSADWVHYDPVMRRLKVQYLMVQVPLGQLFSKEMLPDDQVRAASGSHFYLRTPECVYLSADDVRFEQGVRDTTLVLNDVKVTHSSVPDPDLYLTAREVRVLTGERVEFVSLALWLSGFKAFSWPRYSKNFKTESQPYTLGFPTIRLDREVGIAWKQKAFFDLQAVKGEADVDYSPEYGLLTHGYAYLVPTPGAQLGIAAGRRIEVDIHRRSVVRGEQYNLMYRQDFKGAGDWIYDLNLQAEYGQMSAMILNAPELGLPDVTVKDQRVLASADLQLGALPIAGEFYLTAGGQASYVNYLDHDETYEVIGGRAGVIYHQPGFNHFVVYRQNHTEGKALFSFDEVRDQQVDFATSFKLIPEFRHVVRGIYNVDDSEFDLLQVGAMKQQRSYEVGLYWDFARDSAGVEFGLRVE